jgi:uncharacterized protein YndB with AHSA1/START domain
VHEVRTARTERTISAPPERVFEVLSDHARYDRFRGIRGSTLLREGQPPPNGLGALRRILIGPLRFEEEITVYEDPTRLDYLIVQINAPFDHQGGSIRLTETDGGTHAEWTSTFRVRSLLGPLQERVWAIALGRGFGRVLADVERILNP